DGGLQNAPAPREIEIEVGSPGLSERRRFVPGAGKTQWFRDAAPAPEMVVIPSGSFVMGAPPDEQSRSEDEGPQHEIVIARSFAVARNAVTLGKFTPFVEATSRIMPDKIFTLENETWQERFGSSFRYPGFTQGARHPVVGVSWQDATDYVAWLAEK